MNRRILIGISAASCLALSAMSAFGQGAVPDHNLSEFKPGAVVSGDEVDISKLEGKVVVFEYWGTQ